MGSKVRFNLKNPSYGRVSGTIGACTIVVIAGQKSQFI